MWVLLCTWICHLSSGYGACVKTANLNKIAFFVCDLMKTFFFLKNKDRIWAIITFLIILQFLDPLPSWCSSNNGGEKQAQKWKLWRPKLNYKQCAHPPFDWQLNHTWSSEKGSIMSQIIDKAIVLFLKHKGRETQNEFRSVSTAAALTAEQACGEGFVSFLLEPTVHVLICWW